MFPGIGLCNYGILFLFIYLFVLLLLFYFFFFSATVEDISLKMTLS